MTIATSSLRFFFVLFFISFSTSCAKKEARPSISMSFSSQNGSLSTSIKHIFVNVTNKTGVTPTQVFERDCESQSCTHLVFEIASGGQHLIQVLVLTEDETEVVKLNYGDAEKDLTSGDNAVPIQLELKGSFSSEGKIIGRYIPKSSHPLAGKKLTGDITMKVFVGVGKPDMKLMQSEIFGGWLNLFALDSVGFKYLFSGFDQNGVSFLNVPVLNDIHNASGLTLSSLGIQPNSNKIVHYNLNSDVFDEREGGVFQQRPFDKKIIGFFGQSSGALAGQLCAKTLSDGTLLNGVGRSHVCKTVDATQTNCLTHYTWGEIRTDSATAPATLNGQTDSCVGNPTHLEVNLGEIGGGDEGILPVYGPFYKNSAIGLNDIVEVNNSTRELAWAIQPGVKLPGGVDVFVSSDVSSFDRHSIRDRNEGFDCARLPNHFNFQSNVPANPGTKSSIIIPQNSFNPNTGFALCPKRPDGKYFGAAIISDGNGGSGGNQSSLVEMELYGSSNGGIVLVPGFEFGGAKWTSGDPYVMEPNMPGGTMDMYIVIKNKMLEDIQINNFHVNFPMPGWSIVASPGSTPAGVNTCGASTLTLQEEGAAANADRCAIRIDFDATNYTGAGLSVHNGFTVDAELISDSSHQGKMGFPIIGGTYLNIDRSDGLMNLDMYAPPGEVDIKHIRLNNIGGTTWNVTIPASGTMWGNYRIDYGGDCPSILAGLDCFLTVTLDNRNGSLTTDNVQSLSSHAFGGGTAAIDSYYYTYGPTSSEGNPYDFLNISGAVNHDFFVTNNSQGLISFGDAAITNESGTHTLADAAAGPIYCDGASGLGMSAQCDFTINMAYSSGYGPEREWLFIPYDILGTYRAFHFDVLVNHQ